MLSISPKQYPCHGGTAFLRAFQGWWKPAIAGAAGSPMKIQPLAEAQEGPSERVVGIDEVLEQLGEQPPPGRIQRGYRPVMRASDRRFHAPQELRALGRQAAHLESPVVAVTVAGNQPAAFEAPQHAGNGGPVDADFRRQRGLVHRRVIGQHGHQAELDRRDAEIRAFLEEDRDVDLVEPADQEAGTLPQGKGR